MKLLIIASFSDFPIYFRSLLTTFSYIAALEHYIVICSLNFNWLSIQGMPFNKACQYSHLLQWLQEFCSTKFLTPQCAMRTRVRIGGVRNLVLQNSWSHWSKWEYWHVLFMPFICHDICGLFVCSLNFNIY